MNIQTQRSWNPRARVEAVLRGGHADRMPFTMYENMIPQCTAEREMRNRGLCIVNRRVPVFTTHQPHVQVRAEPVVADGKRLVRTHYETPVGAVSTLTEPAGFTTWTHDRMFKTPADYKVLKSLIQDEQYQPNYAAFFQAQADFGEDAIFRAGIGLEPLQALISGNYLAMQDFCIQWMENRDEILELYRAIVENHRRIYPLVADSPASHANYGGNVVPDIIGLKTFEQFYLPHYQEAADVLHRKGKLLGCHLDDDCRLLAPAIARSALDYIEAFTPAPDTDLTLGEARQAWPTKVIWLNFPSSVHLRPNEEVKNTTLTMLEELPNVDGILMGITEDIPPDRWQGSCRAIMDGLDAHHQRHPKLYA